MNTGGVTLDVGKMTSNKKETYKQTHKPPKTQKSRARWLPRGILSTASRRKTTYATKKLLRKIERDGILPSSFLEASITLTPKPKTPKGDNAGPMSLIKADAHLLHKI